MTYEDKEVLFSQYCETCEHYELSDKKYPCDICLERPCSKYSHMPVMYKEKKTEK